MDRFTVIAVLDELLAREQSGLPSRILESTVFVSQLSIDDDRLVRRMADAQREHCAWLTDAILQLGTAPAPRMENAASADLHFQNLHHLIPRLIADRDAIIARYERAIARLAGDAETTALFLYIVQRHCDELVTLKEATPGRITATD